MDEMNINSDTQAAMLLTVWFGRQPEKPLTIKEWYELKKQLQQYNLKPAHLLKENPHNLPCEWDKTRVTPNRLKALLDRGSALGFALEKWKRSGLWVLTENDEDYPKRLSHRLATKAPPILFGYGNRRHLNKGGIAVVGSRHADQEDLDLTHVIGEEAARQGYAIVSGGARGVDESAMLGTLERNGTALGVMANNLLTAALSARFRNFILSGNLTLTSPFNPEARFHIGNAMARNKLIYCLADTALVINSALAKGSTWAGAIEGLKSNWVPIWVQKKNYENDGNTGLFKKGASWLPYDLSSLKSLTRFGPADGRPAVHHLTSTHPIR